MPNVETPQVLELIYAAVRDQNEVDSGENQIEQSPDTVLFGTGGKLDSLMFISLIVAIEDVVQEKFDVALSLADERALTQTPQVFRTLGSLASHISDLLTEGDDG